MFLSFLPDSSIDPNTEQSLPLCIQNHLASLASQKEKKTKKLKKQNKLKIIALCKGDKMFEDCR